MNDPRFVVAARDGSDMDVASAIETVVNRPEFLEQFQPLLRLVELRQKMQGLGEENGCS